MQSNGTKISSSSLYDRIVLTAIVALLGIIALRPFAEPRVASAQAEYNYLYFEPGTTSLRAPDGSRQVEGRMVVDMRNGNVWGFPTLSASPYPLDGTKTEPTVSEPFYLGKFDLGKIRPK